MAPFANRPTPDTHAADPATARTFSIGVLVRRFNISAESLRNWERAGLIPRAHRTPGGHRRYGRDHVDAVYQLLYAPGAIDVDDLDEQLDDDTADENAATPGHAGLRVA